MFLYNSFIYKVSFFILLNKIIEINHFLGNQDHRCVSRQDYCRSLRAFYISYITRSFSDILIRKTRATNHRKLTWYNSWHALNGYLPFTKEMHMLFTNFRIGFVSKQLLWSLYTHKTIRKIDRAAISGRPQFTSIGLKVLTLLHEVTELFDPLCRTN